MTITFPKKRFAQFSAVYDTTIALLSLYKKTSG